MMNALGIAACHAAGISLTLGTMVKSLQVGSAAMNGARAALLAKRGFCSPEAVLEREHGFACLHGTEDIPDGLSATGGYFTLEILFKDYPCCFALHGVVDAALRLRQAPAYDPGLVKDVLVHAHPGLQRLCSLRIPTTPEEARFSLPYAVALVLVGGDPASLESWVPSNVQTPQMFAMMQRVRARVAVPQAQHSCTLRVAQFNAPELTATTSLRAPSSELSTQWSRLESKFLRLTTPTIGELRARQLSDAIYRVVDLAEVTKLVELTIPEHTTVRAEMDS